MKDHTLNYNFWENKKVLITGNTGFKGSWLTLLLKSMGADVIGYSLPPPTNPSLFELAQVHRNITMITGDVRDKRLLLETLDKYKPQIVIHMAAQALVRASYLDPVGTFETNIMGTAYLLDAIRQVPGVRATVIITSDKCYENKEHHRPYKETDPMGGFDPYSCSKGCDELIISAYRRSFFSSDKCNVQGVALASVRAGNVVGGGDWGEDRLVADAMKSFMAKKALIIRHPNAVRPWQHVLDPLFGYLLLVEKLYNQGQKFASAWNFGPERGDSKPVSWVVDMLCQYWGDGASWSTEKKASPLHEASLLFLDSNKALRELGWKPRLNITQSLDWTVKWFKAYNDSKDMRKVSLEQLTEYQKIKN
jgi:CDP-glucose 4,6-dehydratase